MIQPYYRIDDLTFSHLSTWCDNELRDNEREAVRDRMLDYLASCEPDEAEYSLSHGWTHIRDLVA